MSKIKVRFLIDKEQKRVVLAEAGSDFVDVLFSFLTLPLGSVVRLLKKLSGMGSLDSLYESIEQLDIKHLQTDDCKEMLLNPRSAAAELCEDLKISNIHDLNPRSLYTCNGYGCLINSALYYTYTRKCPCPLCGKLMDKKLTWTKAAENQGGVFITNGTREFIITDDLQVIPTSLKKGISLLKEMQIKDASILEERVIDFGTEEALILLGRSLVSKNALTGVYFPDSCIQKSTDCSLLIKKERELDEAKDEIIINLVLNTISNNVLYAEVGEDFVNLLLSFLTFPLGSVFRLLTNTSIGGCINNLYSSAKSIGLDCFKSEICRNMILTPKLSTFYAFKNHMLEMEEIASKECTTSGSCIKCYWDNGNKLCTPAPCKHGVSVSEWIEQNPKLVEGVEDSDGAFVSGSRSFMIADNLHISPLSFISAIGDKLKWPTSNLVVKEVSIDRDKALSILHAMLISKTVLTDVCYPKNVSYPEPKLQRKSQRV